VNVGFLLAADDVVENGAQLDIMAQQLKFVACLKILMEELSTLATGFEVDGGQLRYHLYIWLEALRQLCNYSFGDIDSVSAGELTCLIGTEVTNEKILYFVQDA